MRQLSDALADIAEIRARMSGAETYYGCRAAAVGYTGGLGLLAAAMQNLCIPEPLADLQRYVLYWSIVAFACLVLVAMEMVSACRRDNSSLTRHKTKEVVRQFAPCLCLGALFTAVILRFARDAAWMLPGVWSLFFSLGNFASYRLLPNAASGAGAYYAVAGCICLSFGPEHSVLSPLSMAATFGAGQLLLSVLIYQSQSTATASVADLQESEQP